jgi:hypothetical protein
VRVGLATAALLPQFFPDVPVRPLEWASAPPRRELIVYPFAGDTQDGDLYLPAGGVRRGAVILVLGVHPLPRNDPLVVQVASGLARAGLVTLVPVDEDLNAGRILPRAVDGLVGAFDAVAARPEVDPSRIGYLGFSVGSALALLAASDDRIRDRVAFVNAFGGYFDARDLFLSVASHSLEWEGEVRSWEPAPLAIVTFREQMIAAVPGDEERRVLTALLLTGEEQPEGTADRLTGVARTVYELTLKPERAEAARLWERLPQSARADWRRLSPRTVVDRLRTTVYVMHDVADAYVPYTESRRLNAALGPATPHRYTEFRIFQHVVPSNTSDLGTLVGDGLTLYLNTMEMMLKVL